MKTLPKSPSISPSATLRDDINSRIERGLTIHGVNRAWPAGASPRINQIYSRFDIMRQSLCIDLSDEEKFILIECLNGSVIDAVFIECLADEITDSDHTNKNLIEKIAQASIAERVATIDLLGY